MPGLGRRETERGQGREGPAQQRCLDARPSGCHCIRRSVALPPPALPQHALRARAVALVTAPRAYDAAPTRNRGATGRAALCSSVCCTRRRAVHACTRRRALHARAPTRTMTDDG